MRKFLFTAAFFSFALLRAETFQPLQTEAEIKEELSFLTSVTEEVGFAYRGTAGELNGLLLPLSYYSTPDYWGKYVGSIPGNNLEVVDAYNKFDYTLTPTMSSPGKDLQVERINVFNGTDIYDAACWQIALAVCAKAGLNGPENLDLFAAAEGQNQLLLLGYDGNATQTRTGANRALTNNGVFEYNGKSITDPKKAFFFRMVTRNWLSTDPFIGTEYMKYVKAENLPSNPEYQPGKVSWMDWKPITGENAWAFFIGPLQVEKLKQSAANQSYVPFSSTAVQNALGVLTAIRTMQSEVGGIYYACKGSLGNQGARPVNPFEVSVENNASALAGLYILQNILKDELDNETELSSDQKSKIKTALSQINVVLFGGDTPQGKKTRGLLSFFHNNAWDANEGIFYQGGDANNPHIGVEWKPTSEPKAVDVSTWGVAVLGQKQIDAWHGFGSAYNIWDNVKSWGGFYGPDGDLWGVGYSDRDGNGKNGNYERGIISAEWTAGAINMLRCLITQYGAFANSNEASPEEKDAALNYIKQMQADHDSMYKNLMSLRTDNYGLNPAYSKVRPDGYEELIPIPQGKLGFVYASKRYMIPFGWFANPLPSTTSTAWIIMLHYNFNPFHPAGSYE